MSTNKLLQSLSEDPQLEKQIGCMAGILQIFDRHQVLTGRRLYGHKRIASAARSNPSSTTCGSPGSEEKAAMSHNSQLLYAEETLKHATELLAAPRMPSESRAYTAHTNPIVDKDLLLSSSLTAMGMARMSLDCREQHPRASFEVRGPAPSKLDSSRSLQEGRLNPQEGKIFPRRSVDTAERARGTLKEFSRETAKDATSVATLNIRDIVRASFQKDPVKVACADKARAESMAAANKSPGIGLPPVPPGIREAPRPHRTGNAAGSELSKSAKEMQSFQALHGKDLPGISPHCKLTKQGSARTVPELNESLRLLANMRNMADNRSLDFQPRVSVDHNKQKEGSRFALSRDQPPRSAYDSNGNAYAEPARFSSVDCSKELFRGGQRAPSKEMPPRLSLDGRLASPGANSAYGGGGKLVSRNLNSRSVSCNNSDCDSESLHEGTRRSSTNVVARLMGLDDLPTRTSSGPQPTNKPPLDANLQPQSVPLSNSAPHPRSPSPKGVTETYPKFSQCGKYVSASFFPSKRRDFISISLNASDEEEEEVDGSLYFDCTDAPMSEKDDHQAFVGQGFVHTPRSQGSRNAYNRAKDDSSTEGRSDHLASVTKLCMQIEEMQRTDRLAKDVDRRLHGLPGSQSSMQDLQALKQLLDTLHIRNQPQISRTENSEIKTRMQNDRWNGRQQDSSLECKTKRVLTEQRQGQEHTRLSMEASHNRNRFVDVKLVRPGRSRCPSPDQSPRSRDGRSNASSPRKANSPRNAARVDSSNGSPRRHGAHANSFTNVSNNTGSPSNCKVTSPKGQPTGAKSNIQKQSKRSETVSRNKGSAQNVIKDREESRANLASLKSQSGTRRTAPSPTINTRSNKKVPNQAPRTRAARASPEEAPPCKVDLSEDEHFTDKEVVTSCAVSFSNFHSEKDVEVLARLEETSAPSPVSVHDNFVQNSPEVDCSWAEHNSDGRTWEASEQSIKIAARPIATSIGTKGDIQRLQVQNEDTESQGDKSTGSCEQPSPVSVLDVSFYEEDPSPKSSSKCALKFEDQIDVETYEVSKGDEEDYCGVEPLQTEWSSSLAAELCDGRGQDDANGDLEYVREVLRKVGSPSDMITKTGLSGLISPMEPHLFFVLEAQRKKHHNNAGAEESLEAMAAGAGSRRGQRMGGEQQVWRRRLLFDAVNASLRKRLRGAVLLQQQPWVLQGVRGRRGRVDGAARMVYGEGAGARERLAKEVMGDVQRAIVSSDGDAAAAAAEHLSSSMGVEDERREDVCDSVSRLLEEDLLEGAQGGPLGADEWFELLAEKGEIALDVERLIFKDLIDYTIRDLKVIRPSSSSSACSSINNHSGSFTRRQLFPAN